jgi:hypothetical protein
MMDVVLKFESPTHWHAFCPFHFLHALPAKLILISARCRRYPNASLLRLFSLRLPFPNSSTTHQQIPSHNDRSHRCMWKCAKTLHAESPNVPFEGKTSHPGPTLLFWHQMQHVKGMHSEIGGIRWVRKSTGLWSLY